MARDCRATIPRATYGFSASDVPGALLPHRPPGLAGEQANRIETRTLRTSGSKGRHGRKQTIVPLDTTWPTSTVNDGRLPEFQDVGADSVRV
jgi:hypothetical protein